jgi:hypothetical protein
VSPEAYWLCWVCSEVINHDRSYFTDLVGITHLIHDWCTASAETMSRRQKAEGG